MAYDSPLMNSFVKYCDSITWWDFVIVNGTMIESPGKLFFCVEWLWPLENRPGGGWGDPSAQRLKEQCLVRPGDLHRIVLGNSSRALTRGDPKYDVGSNLEIFWYLVLVPTEYWISYSLHHYDMIHSWNLFCYSWEISYLNEVIFLNIWFTCRIPKIFFSHFE